MIEDDGRTAPGAAWTARWGVGVTLHGVGGVTLRSVRGSLCAVFGGSPCVVVGLHYVVFGGNPA